MAMLGYATVGSNNLEKAKDFYDALLGSVGVVGQFEHPTGGRIYGRDGVFFFGVLGPYNKQPASVGNGCMFAFKFDTREEVDAFYAKALALGGTDEGPPGYRGPTYYFSYFRDLEGNKLCAYSIG
jgi:catechol 2,3-dioxygenase-like lactoylglutathione lyase family enzyme